MSQANPAAAGPVTKQFKHPVSPNSQNLPEVVRANRLSQKVKKGMKKAFPK